MFKKIVFFVGLFLIISCLVYSQKISCDFSENIVLCFINNLDEIESKIQFADLGHDYRYFYRVENDFFEYLREQICTNKIFDEIIFIEKYNNLMSNIPEESNEIFFEFPELLENGYKHYINYMIHFIIIVYENIFNGNIISNNIPQETIKEINIANIYKIKSLFDENDNEIINKKIELIIEYINKWVS